MKRLILFSGTSIAAFVLIGLFMVSPAAPQPSVSHPSNLNALIWGFQNLKSPKTMVNLAPHYSPPRPRTSEGAAYGTRSWFENYLH